MADLFQTASVDAGGHWRDTCADSPKRCNQRADRRGRRRQEGHQCLQQEDPSQAGFARDQAAPAFPWPSQCRQQLNLINTLVPANSALQITCLYDMDIPRPDNFNETYLYEGRCCSAVLYRIELG